MSSLELFIVRFKADFAPFIDVQQSSSEFQDLRQTTEFIAKITVKLKERDFLVPRYDVEEEMKKMSYHDI